MTSHDDTTQPESRTATYTCECGSELFKIKIYERRDREAHDRMAVCAECGTGLPLKQALEVDVSFPVEGDQ